MKTLVRKYIVAPIKAWWRRLLAKISLPANESDETPAAAHDGADAITYQSLSWTFGGVDGSGAAIDSPRIGDLRMSADSLSYRWVAGDLAAWGMEPSTAGAMACLFVQRADGTWAGGKFDWISSNRLTRSFKNIRAGYNGWKLDGIPNPCQAAFVIIDGGKRRRTNVITAQWRR